MRGVPLVVAVCLLLTAGLLTRCGGGGSNGPPAGPAPTELLGLTSTQQLVRFLSSDPATTRETVSVTGLPAGETLVAIAYEYVGYANWELYGLGSDSRLYALDELSGAASPVGSVPFDPALNGTHFGMAFHLGAADGLHVFSDTGQHLHVSEATGEVLSAGTLGWAGGGGGASPVVTAAAYSYSDVASFVGFESTRNVLVTLDVVGHTAAELAGAGITVSPDASLALLHSFYDPVLSAPGPSAIPPIERTYVTITPAASSTSRLYFSPHGWTPLEDLGVIGGGATIIGLAGHDDY